MGRRGRRRKQLVDVLKKTRIYWKSNDHSVENCLWKRLWTCRDDDDDYDDDYDDYDDDDSGPSH
jgi:hypothetical protein